MNIPRNLGFAAFHSELKARSMNEYENYARQRIEIAEVLEGMTKHPGWAAYSKIVENTMREKTVEAMTPATGVDNAMSLNAVKGSVLALTIALGIPQSIIEEAKVLRVDLAEIDEAKSKQKGS